MTFLLICNVVEIASQMVFNNPLRHLSDVNDFTRLGRKREICIRVGLATLPIHTTPGYYHNACVRPMGMDRFGGEANAGL